MPHPLIPFISTQCRFDYAMSMCGLAGTYALVGSMLPIASPIAAAVYGLTSAMSMRVILKICDVKCKEINLALRIASFISAFFTGSVIGAFLTNAMSLPMSFASGMFLHVAALSTILAVNCIALSCLFCIGAAIGVRLLPSTTSMSP